MDQKILDIIHSTLDSMAVVDEKDIPSIDLYMDQVTTFIDDSLKHSKRHPDDKLLTKTMINNYTKAELIPPPVKKKYSKRQLLLLLQIYYLKNYLSINDIQTLFAPIIKHTVADESTNYSELYKNVTTAELADHDNLVANIADTIKYVDDFYKDSHDGTDEDFEMYEDLLSIIGMLSYDIYVKKRIVENLIDGFDEFFETNDSDKDDLKSEKKAEKTDKADKKSDKKKSEKARKNK